MQRLHFYWRFIFLRRETVVFLPISIYGRSRSRCSCSSTFQAGKMYIHILGRNSSARCAQHGATRHGAQRPWLHTSRLVLLVWRCTSDLKSLLDSSIIPLPHFPFLFFFLIHTHIHNIPFLPIGVYIYSMLLFSYYCVLCMYTMCTKDKYWILIIESMPLRHKEEFIWQSDCSQD